MSRLLGIAASRRGKWLVALVWLVVAAAAGSVSSKFQAAQKNDPASYLPGSAESSRALTKITRISGGDVITPAVVVFHRAGGLTHADLGTISADRATLNARLPNTGVPAGRAFRATDRTAALVTFGLRLHNNDKALTNEVKLIRDVVHRAPPGLDVRVTGPAGSSYDAAQVFKSINGTLLLVTVSLIFVLLILIYRSPIFWFIPLLAVGFAEIASQGIGYLLTRQGITVNGQSAGILTVLVFGAGYRLRPAAGLPLPRGAPPPRRPPRRDAGHPPTGRTGHLRQRRHRDRRPALPAGRPGQRNPRARADRGDGRRPGDRQRPDPAPGAAPDLRSRRLLAVRSPLRVAGRRPDREGRLAGHRRSPGPPSPPGRDRRPRRARDPLCRRPLAEQQPDQRQRLPGVGRVEDRPDAARRALPRRRERPRPDRRVRPGEGRRRGDGGRHEPRRVARAGGRSGRCSAATASPSST